MSTEYIRGLLRNAAVVVAATGVWATGASGEPPLCYAGRPAVLPAPHTYGTPYRVAEARVSYSGVSTRASLPRVYLAPTYYESARAVYAAPSPRYAAEIILGAMAYSTPYVPAYYAPARVIALSSPYYYRRHYRTGYVRHGHGAAYVGLGFGSRLSGVHGYSRHRYGYYGGHRPRGLGVSIGHGRHRRHH